MLPGFIVDVTKEEDVMLDEYTDILGNILNWLHELNEKIY